MTSRGRRASIVGLAGLLGGAACRLQGAGEAGGGEGGLGDRVAREGELLARFLTSAEVLVLVGVVVVVALAFGALSRWVRAWRLRQGFTVGRLTTAGFTVNVAGLLVVVALALRLVFARAPLISSGLVLVAVAALLVTLARAAPAWAVGLGLILRRGVHEGDRLKAGEAEGVVERVGLFRIVLRRPDGARLFLSVVALGGDAVSVASPRAVYPVEVRLTRAEGIGTEERGRIRAIATLCPYRAAASEVAVTTAADDPKACVVRLQSWSATAAQNAEDYLRRAVAGP